MEALFFDRPDEPLGIGVEIRTLRRQPDWPNIATCQDLATDPRVEGIAVLNQRDELLDAFERLPDLRASEVLILAPPTGPLRTARGTVRLTLGPAQYRDDNSSIPLPEASLSA